MRLDKSEVGWIVVGVFFLTGWHSWGEWRYFRFGEWTEARVEGSSVVTRVRDRERQGDFDSARYEFQVLRVDFEYTDIIQAKPVRSSLDFSATSSFIEVTGFASNTSLMPLIRRGQAVGFCLSCCFWLRRLGCSGSYSCWPEKPTSRRIRRYSAL